VRRSRSISLAKGLAGRAFRLPSPPRLVHVGLRLVLPSLRSRVDASASMEERVSAAICECASSRRPSCLSSCGSGTARSRRVLEGVAGDEPERPPSCSRASFRHRGPGHPARSATARAARLVTVVVSAAPNCPRLENLLQVREISPDCPLSRRGDERLEKVDEEAPCPVARKLNEPVRQRHSPVYSGRLARRQRIGPTGRSSLPLGLDVAAVASADAPAGAGLANLLAN
jgi:hypothetical protein